MSGRWQADYAERCWSRVLPDNVVSSRIEIRDQPAIPAPLGSNAPNTRTEGRAISQSMKGNG